MNGSAGQVQVLHCSGPTITLGELSLSLAVAGGITAPTCSNGSRENQKPTASVVPFIAFLLGRALGIGHLRTHAPL